MVPVWHSLVNAGELTITARVKPITFQGYGETPAGEEGGGFPVSLHSSLVAPSVPFSLVADLFIRSRGLATTELWLRSLA